MRADGDDEVCETSGVLENINIADLFPLKAQSSMYGMLIKFIDTDTEILGQASQSRTEQSNRKLAVAGLEATFPSPVNNAVASLAG